MRKLILLLLLSPFLSFSQEYDNNDSYEELFTVFYNLENLFDTINNPNTSDDEE